MDSEVTVKCELCNVGTLIPKDLYGVACSSTSCYKRIVLKPIENHKKYVIVICRNMPNCYWTLADATTVTCICCKAVHDITDDIVETRNEQKIYNSKRRTVEEKPRKDSSATDLTACKDLLKKNEADLAHLQKKNAELQKMIDVEKEAKNLEIEALKTENTSLLKKVEELVEELKEKGKEKDDAGELRLRILSDDIKNAETRKQLEMSMLQRDELVNDKKKMQEQITSLIAINVNLSAAVAKMTAEPAQKIGEKEEVEEEVKEESPKSSEDETKEEDPLIVPCDICGVKSTIQKEQWGAICNDANCPGNKTLVVGKIKEGYRLVRWMCKKLGVFAVVHKTKNTVKCHCCQEDYDIKDVVAEVRNNVKVYLAIPATQQEDEVENLRIKLKNCEENLEVEKKSMAEEVKNALSKTGDVEKVYQKQLKKTEEQNMKLLEELDILRKENDEKEYFYEEKMAHLVEINKLLMKKMIEKGADH